MNRVINIERILFYYDTIHVFVGVDGVHTRYLCLLFDEETPEKFISIKISSTRLSWLLSGNLDLRDAFVLPEIANEYFIIENNDNQYLIIEGIDTPNEAMLPEAGVFFSTANESNEIIEERIEFNKPIIHLGLSDQNNSHSIKADSLSKVLDIYQDFVAYSHKKINTGRRDNEYALNVFATSAASFNIHMYVDAQLNLFGESEIDNTLTVIDGIFNFRNEADLTEKLQPIKGYAISNYKKLLNMLISNGLSIKYKWTTPCIDMPVSYSYIAVNKLQEAYEIITKSKELESENSIYKGYFLKVDSTNGDWKFYDIEQGKEIKGKCLNAGLLSGITVRTADYTIKCTETAEMQNITDKLTKTIYIDSILSE